MSTGSTDMEHKLGPIHDFKHISIYLFIETQTGQNQFNTELGVFREAT